MGNGTSINLVYFFSVEFMNECFQRMIELFCGALDDGSHAVLAKIRREGAWMSAERLEKGPVPLPPWGKAPPLHCGHGNNIAVPPPCRSGAGLLGNPPQPPLSRDLLYRTSLGFHLPSEQPAPRCPSLLAPALLM